MHNKVKITKLSHNSHMKYFYDYIQGRITTVEQVRHKTSDQNAISVTSHVYGNIR